METPYEFEVLDALFDEEHRSLLLGGRVPDGARVASGMKLSVAVDRSFAYELHIARVVPVDRRGGHTYYAVWIDASGAAEAALLRGLGIEKEPLLVWNAFDRVDPKEHFEYGDTYAELTIDLKAYRRAPPIG